jgi:hypothetical protein
VRSAQYLLKDRGKTKKTRVNMESNIGNNPKYDMWPRIGLIGLRVRVVAGCYGYDREPLCSIRKWREFVDRLE